MPKLALTDEEHAAVVAALRKLIADRHLLQVLIHPR
jgi:hypothetical protein